MLRYEIKKVFSKTSSKIAVIILVLLLGVTCWFAVLGISYVNNEGDSVTGFAAIGALREEKKQWSGILTEEKIRAVIMENARLNATSEALSKELKKQNIVYGKKQGFMDIRELITGAFGGFRDYDYYTVDSLSPEDAADFYPNRTEQVKRWLDSEAKDQFSVKEKNFILQKYEELDIPMQYDFADGWLQLFQYAPTLFMLMVLVLGFLTAGIFSGEFQLRADPVFYSTFHGRGRAITAKIKAGLFITTVIYWASTLLYTGIVLGIIGADGGNCPIQATRAGWKSFYNITNIQKYLLLVIGGYVGTLFIISLTMLVSAKLKSTVVAVTIPFMLIFLPSFLSAINSPVVTKILGVMPDQLLQVNLTLNYFNLYEIGGKVMGAMGPLLVIYFALTIVLCPILYHTYKNAKLK